MTSKDQATLDDTQTHVPEDEEQQPPEPLVTLETHREWLACDNEPLETIQDTRFLLEGLTGSIEYSEWSDEELAKVSRALRELDDTIEEVRKEHVDDELEERLDVGDSVCGISRFESSTSRFPDPEGTVEAIREAGGDPTRAMSLKIGAFRELARELELAEADHLEASSYSYLRRDG